MAAFFKEDRAVLQDLGELQQFISIAQSENVCSYLEIGVRHGGCLWRMANAMPIGSKVVAVDFAHKMERTQAPSCVNELKSAGYDAHFIFGDSNEPDTVERVSVFAPFDLCFIDANHSRESVEKDWLNYGAMARIVAFHDLDNQKGAPDVAAFWNQIKHDFERTAVLDMHSGNGIGVIWRD